MKELDAMLEKIIQSKKDSKKDADELIWHMSPKNNAYENKAETCELEKFMASMTAIEKAIQNIGQGRQMINRFKVMNLLSEWCVRRNHDRYERYKKCVKAYLKKWK